MIENRDKYDPTKYRLYITGLANKYPVDDIIKKDLIQEGYIGIYEASLNYDPTKGIAFISYATFYIRRNMNNFMNKTLTTVKRPLKMIKEKETIQHLSLDKSLSEDSNLTLEDVLPSNDILPSIEEKESVIAQNELIESLLSQLKEEHQLIIKMYYGIGYEFPKNGEEIAKELNCTRQNISEKLKLIHKKLKQNVRKKDIE